jgi:hypothetical protein
MPLSLIAGVNYFFLCTVVCVTTILSVILRDWYAIHQQSKIRVVCEEYALQFEATGLRIECQFDSHVNGHPFGCYISFYPVMGGNTNKHLDYPRDGYQGDESGRQLVYTNADGRYSEYP